MPVGGSIVYDSSRKEDQIEEKTGGEYVVVQEDQKTVTVLTRDLVFNFALLKTPSSDPLLPFGKFYGKL